jgi:hypothetical protein
MAGAGFKTWVDGDILTAADVNTYLMEQAVMVFATSTARTTALPTPSEGMVSYLADSNVVEVYTGAAWVSLDDPNAIQNTIVDAKGDIVTATAADTPARLAVGTDGHVLTADSATATGLKWAASSSGALVKISASTFTSQTAVTFDNVFTSTYTNYFVTFIGEASTPTGISFRFRAAGADITAANYHYQGLLAFSTTVQASRTTGQTKGLAGVCQDPNTANSFEGYIYQPQVAKETASTFTIADTESVGGVTVYRVYANYYDATTQMDGIKFLADSGNFTGTITIYGLEK